MGRPVTLFTGQWADLPLTDMCRMAADFGYQGLELACWGDHFEVDKALEDDGYCAAKRIFSTAMVLSAMRSVPTWLGKPYVTISTNGTSRFCLRISGVMVILPESTIARSKK